MQLLIHALTLEAWMSDYIPQKVMDLIIILVINTVTPCQLTLRTPGDATVVLIIYNIMNNALVTVNNDFGSRVRRFTN